MTLKMLGHSRVSKDKKVTVIEEANEIVSLNPGDFVAWYRDEDNGNLVLKKASLVPVG